VPLFRADIIVPGKINIKPGYVIGDGNAKKDMKNFFYSAADKIGQKLDGILYRLPTWHPIYSMPFGQSKNIVIYSPERAEYLRGGICRRLAKRYS